MGRHAEVDLMKARMGRPAVVSPSNHHGSVGYPSTLYCMYVYDARPPHTVHRPPLPPPLKKPAAPPVVGPPAGRRGMGSPFVIGAAGAQAGAAADGGGVSSRYTHAPAAGPLITTGESSPPDPPMRHRQCPAWVHARHIHGRDDGCRRCTHYGRCRGFGMVPGAIQVPAGGRGWGGQGWGPGTHPTGGRRPRAGQATPWGASCGRRPVGRHRRLRRVPWRMGVSPPLPRSSPAIAPPCWAAIGDGPTMTPLAAHRWVPRGATRLGGSHQW